MLQRGAPKLGKDGKPMKDKHGKVIYEPYRIKVLNTSFRTGMGVTPDATKNGPRPFPTIIPKPSVVVMP